MQAASIRAKVYSVNVSGPLRTVVFAGHTVRTGFFKSAVQGVSHVRSLGIEGDAQGDLSVHGGLGKAVYFYPQEHYGAWERLLGSGPLPPGSFGENITSAGLLETDLHIGDVLRIGTATLQVLQPRSPCYKLQIRFGRPDMTALFFQQGKPGWYASVLHEGAFSADDEISLVERPQEEVTVADIWRYSAQDGADPVAFDRIQHLPLLPEFWKQRISRRALG